MNIMISCISCEQALEQCNCNAKRIKTIDEVGMNNQVVIDFIGDHQRLFDYEPDVSFDALLRQFEDVKLRIDQCDREARLGASFNVYFDLLREEAQIKGTIIMWTTIVKSIIAKLWFLYEVIDDRINLKSISEQIIERIDILEDIIRPFEGL